MSGTSEILTIRPSDISEIIERLEHIEKTLGEDRFKTSNNEILTVEEACKYLKVSLPTLYRYIKTLDLPSIKVGHQRRFRKWEIIQWCEQQKI